MAVMSKMSSRIWNTMPKQWPYSVSASTSCRRQAAGERADAAGGRHERGGLAGDGGGVLLVAPGDLEGGAHLGDLSLAEPGQRLGQKAGDLGAQAGRDGGRAGQEVVAGHNGHQVPETAVYALDVAPDGGLVQHVVVVERRQVDQFHRHGSQQLVLGGRPLPTGGGGERQQGTQPLATCGDEMRGHRIEEGVAGDDGRGEQGLEAVQPLLQQGQIESLRRIHSP